MIEIKLFDCNVNSVIEIVHNMRTEGYLQGRDFDFMYHPPVYDSFGHEAPTRRYTVFTFYKDELASWFSLRYN